MYTYVAKTMKPNGDLREDYIEHSSLQKAKEAIKELMESHYKNDELPPLKRTWAIASVERQDNVGHGWLLIVMNAPIDDKFLITKWVMV